MVFSPSVLMLTTANSRSTVCRADYLAYIGVKRFDREGRVVGERRFLGLYNSDVYRDSVLDIPLLRDKAAEVLDRAGFAAESHSGRALRQILETYPRNELFQIDADELYEIATGILELQDRRQVRLFERRDDYGRFVSCLVYLPRDRYSTDRAEQIAERARGGLRRDGHRARGPDRDGRAGPAPRARRARRGGPPPADPRCREAPQRHRGGLVRRARRRAGGRAGGGCRSRRAGPLRQRVPRRLPGRLPAVDGRRRCGPPPGDRGGCRPHHRAAPSSGRRAGGGAVHADATGRTARAVRGAAPPGGPGRHGGRRADPRDPRRGAQRLALRHRTAGLGPRPDRRPRHPGGVLRHLRRALPGRAGERRAEPAGGGGRALGPPGRRAPGLREVPAPDRPVVQPALRRDDAGPPLADRRCARAAVRDAVRPVDRSRRRPRRQPGPRRPTPGPSPTRSPRSSTPCPAWTRTASSARSSP